MPGKSKPSSKVQSNVAVKKRGPPKRKGVRAGLIFPVTRCVSMFKRGHYSDRVGVGAGIFTAAILEYLTSEICELAGNAAEENKKKTIQPRHLMLAIKNDEELNKLVAQTTIA